MRPVRPLGQAGITLVELMVVVVIIGVLSTAAVLSFDRSRDSAAVADALVAKVRECVRLATTNGPLRADVAATGITARARLVIDEVGTAQTAALERFVEDALPADTGTWQPVGSMAIGPDVSVVGSRPEAVTTEASSPTAMLTSDTLEIECFPDGTTAARTVFLQGQRASERARVTILPLTGEAVATRGW